METRNDAWLEARTQWMIQTYFADMPKGLPIKVLFGARARYRFGSIAPRNGVALIRINRLFADPELPLYVLDETLAHELVHYAHGFGSGLPRQYAHPHKGGIVERELTQRGLGENHRLAETWRKQHWEAFYAVRCPDIHAGKALRTEARQDLWEQFLERPESRTPQEIETIRAQIAQKLPLVVAPEPEIKWLRATLRQTAPSYYYPKQSALQLHGLLSDRRVPQAVLEFEIAYWLLRLGATPKWEEIHTLLWQSGLGATTRQALHWRQRSWTRFRNRYHPLQK